MDLHLFRVVWHYLVPFVIFLYAVWHFLLSWTRQPWVVAWQCDEVWSRKVNQDSSDLKVIVLYSHSVEQIFRSVIQLRLQLTMMSLSLL